MEPNETLPPLPNNETVPPVNGGSYEYGLPNPETGSTGGGAPIAAQTPAVSPAYQAFDDPQVTQAAAQISMPSEDDLAADDIDLIEKQWVLKAKNVVTATMGDPYKQNKELNKVRADYIKKRYNKDIKLSAE
ncbi:MAG: hypothetical protein M3Q79_04035 [bacterium]|nr:hypothetical protein [bacterium]